MNPRTLPLFVRVVILVTLGQFVMLASQAPVDALGGAALVRSLRDGGYVIVMRHASSPRETPNSQTANPDNVNLERQLDATGRATAAAMGKALRDLKIPIGEVLTSPTYRALETLRFAQIPNAKPAPELGDGGQSMQVTTDAQAAWLKARVAQAPKGSNTLLVTHMPNISRAFAAATGVADGESLIFHPDGKGGAALVARVKIEDWPRLQP